MCVDYLLEPARASTPKSPVYLRADPEQVAACVLTNSFTPSVTIATLDGKALLTAEYGTIHLCPDLDFYLRKLHPAMVKQLNDPYHPLPFQHLGANEVAGYQPPFPDWNYLFVYGYGDEQFQRVINGDGLLNLELEGIHHKVSLGVSPYQHLDVFLNQWENGLPKPWFHLTASPDGRVLKQDYAFLQVNDPKVARLCPWLEKNHVAALVAEADQFCEFPLYRFNLPLLREMDPMGFLRHEQTMAFCDSILPDEEPPYQQQMQ